jgi:hypothetical protein
LLETTHRIGRIARYAASAQHIQLPSRYAMQIEEAMTFNEYWNDPRFQKKKPSLVGSKKQAFGDNIYFKPPRAKNWKQLNSHHSFADGTQNNANVNNDTQVDRVLIGTNFMYWGGVGPKIPQRFQHPPDSDIRAKRGHRSNFSEAFVEKFLVWIRSKNVQGYVGEPLDWMRTA